MGGEIRLARRQMLDCTRPYVSCQGNWTLTHFNLENGTVQNLRDVIVWVLWRIDKKGQNQEQGEELEEF